MGLFARGDTPRELSSLAFLQAMLDVETALLRALVRAGLAPAETADELVAAADATTLDLPAIGRSTAENGTPVPGMLSQLRERLSEHTAAQVHRGATSQDIVDTAMMLVARRALVPILADLDRVTEAAATLAERHRQTAIAGRTLLQQALPLSFGLKASGWLVALAEARAELERLRARGLAIQLGGPVGTLAAFGDGGLEVTFHLADELGLEEPPLPWHTARRRPVALACGLGTAAGTMGKVAQDVILLAQTEVAEVAERGEEGHGGSSAMAHKRNPVGAVAVVACSKRTPALVATMLGTMVQEHERAAGAWQAEWETMLALLRLTGSAAATLAEVLVGLEPDPQRMAHNLAPLLQLPGVADTLGSSEELIDRALAVYRDYQGGRGSGAER